MSEQWRIASAVSPFDVVDDAGLFKARCAARETAEQIVRDHNEAVSRRAVGLKLETFAAIARAISSDAKTLESALSGISRTLIDR